MTELRMLDYLIGFGVPIVFVVGWWLTMRAARKHQNPPIDQNDIGLGE
jgi:hypothetical protein